MLTTCALMVCSLSPDCLSQVSKPSRIGWFACLIACTRCSYVWAWSASVMQPLSFRSAVLLPLVSSFRQDRLAILGFFATTHYSWMITCLFYMHIIYYSLRKKRYFMFC